MSLINEALKKAQRVRTGDTVGSLASMPGGGSRVAKRSAPRTAQQLVLIAAGAIVLIVLSVVATVFLVNRPSDPKPAVAATLKLAGATPAAKTPTASPVIVVPLGAPAPAAADPAPLTPVSDTQLHAAKPNALPSAPINAPPARTAAVASTPPDTKPALATPAVIPTARPPAAPPAVEPAPASSTPVAATPSPNAPAVPSTTAPTPVSAPPAVAAERSAPAQLPVAPSPPRLDERAILFVDAIKVAGVRAAGTESRVLLNDRVFRINEIVERNFGLRLSKVESNTLTFTDANGAVYVKHL
jgi:hypothetical protein